MRYTIDPANFTDGQWEELYENSTVVPRKYEQRDTAKPFNRPRHYIELAIQNLHNSVEWAECGDDELRAKELTAAAGHLRSLIGPARITRKAARERLYSILTSDIYTDAPEYADRVEEIPALLSAVFGGKR